MTNKERTDLAELHALQNYLRAVISNSLLHALSLANVHLKRNRKHMLDLLAELYSQKHRAFLRTDRKHPEAHLKYSLSVIYIYLE